MVPIYDERVSYARPNIPTRKDVPFSGANFPPCSIVFRNDEGARLNEPSGCLFIFVISDCNAVSLVVDMARRQDSIWVEVKILQAGRRLDMAVNDLDN